MRRSDITLVYFGLIFSFLQQTLQQEIANAMPNVNTTCENGEKLKSMSEADNRDKEEFGQNVANMQRRWEMLKATAVEVCERHRVACDRTSEFIDDHLNPLMDWIMEVEPLLGEKYTIGGDAAALDELQQKFDVSDYVRACVRACVHTCLLSQLCSGVILCTGVNQIIYVKARLF